MASGSDLNLKDVFMKSFPLKIIVTDKTVHNAFSKGHWQHVFH